MILWTVKTRRWLVVAATYAVLLAIVSAQAVAAPPGLLRRQTPEGGTPPPDAASASTAPAADSALPGMRPAYQVADRSEAAQAAGACARIGAQPSE